MRLLASFRWLCLSALCAWLLAPSAASAQTAVDPDDVLTEEVVTRVLGLEKDDLAGGSESADKVRKLMAEGVMLFRNGQGDPALAKFEEARNVDASLPPADVFIARLCFAVGDQNFVRLGLQVLNRAADKHPEAPEPYLMFGQLALLEGRLTDAYVLFEKAGEVINARESQMSEAKVKLYKKNAYAGRVSVCEQRQNWDQGLNEMVAWMALDDGDPSALFRKGRLLFLKDPKNDQAVAEARSLLEGAYDEALVEAKEKKVPAAVVPAELALLELYTANGNVPKARAEIAALDKQAAEWEANPLEGSRVYSSISQWYLGQGEFEKAEEYAKKAKALDANAPALRQLQAVAAYFNRKPEAETEFTQMNQAQPDDFFAANFLALTLADAKLPDGKPDEDKRAKAIRIAEVNARLNPKNPVALATLGWVYYNVNRIGEAAQLFAALEQQPNLQVSPDMAYYMARTYAQLPSAQYPGALGRAKTLLESAVKASGAFRYRAEATQWLDALVGGGGPAPVPANGAANNAPAGNAVLNPPAPKEEK